MMKSVRKIKLDEFCKKNQTAFCLLSLVKISVFSLLFVGVQVQMGIAQVRPNPQQAQEEVLIRLLTNTPRARTIKEIPPSFIEAVKKVYDNSPEIKKESPKFEPYLATKYFWTLETIDLRAGKILSKSSNATAGICDDGGCEEQGIMSKNVWSGYYTGGVWWNRLDDASIGNIAVPGWTDASAGAVIKNDASIPFDFDFGTASTDWFARCNNHPNQAHFSVVNAGNDPLLGSLLPTTAPVPGNNRAIRMGNLCIKAGGEKLEKSFVVQAGQTDLSFWYATVLQNPNHDLSAQPGFGVYLYANGVNISNLMDIDAGTSGTQNFIAANQNNPFFSSFSYNSAAYHPVNPWQILYRPWTHVSVNLNAYIGQTVTVVFVNRDCMHSGDFGYSYIDGFCMTGKNTPTGWAEYNKTKSDCAKGEICFDYTVPKTPNGASGKVNLTLELYQNGSLVKTLNSGDLTADGTYCFQNVSNGLNASLGGFDWRAISNFTLTGATIAPKEIGKIGDGYVEGKNNDCAASEPGNFCCPGKNLVKNGSFHLGNTGFKSDYKYGSDPIIFDAGQVTAGSATGGLLQVLNPQMAALAQIPQPWLLYAPPGSYLVGDSVLAKKQCDKWNVNGHGNCSDPKDKFLMVNGRTSQTTGNKLVWSQDVQVEGGKDYRFCSFMKNLPNCCFDKKPKVTVRSNINGTQISNSANVINTTNGTCDWQLVSQKFKIPGSGTQTLKLEILLDENGDADGNDLAIDDISLMELNPVDPNAMAVQQESFNVTATSYSLKVTAPPLPNSTCKGVWKVVEVDNNNNPIGTPKVWNNVNPNVFGGFNAPPTAAGVFSKNKRYKVSYEVECDCSKPTVTSWILQYLQNKTVLSPTAPSSSSIN